MKLLAWASALIALWAIMLAAALGSALSSSGQAAPEGAATVEGIPSQYFTLYRFAAEKYEIDWAILAAVGKIETDHGRSSAVGVQPPRTNFHGCCAGPMQFCVIDGCPAVGPRELTVAQAQNGTWESMGVDGNGDGVKNPWDPADAIPAAARYLKASGAPGDYRRAILSYNHSEEYYRNVTAQAVAYRNASLTRTGQPSYVPDASVREVLENPNIGLNPGQRSDLRSGGIDPRTLATLSWIGRRHKFIVTSLRKDHSPGSNHEAGRAFDIGAVDQWICRGGSSDPCADLVRELAAVQGPMRSTELIYCWDPDPADPGMFARGDHCDHIHWGHDG